jgi:release factor H-coupled RctB family protein
MTSSPVTNDITLPPWASIVQGEGVWMEGNALSQFAQIASLPGCVKAVGMPDMHAGGTAPIGAVFAFDDGVRPTLLGGDVGCGVLVLATSENQTSGDALERRVRAAFDDDEPFADADQRALVAAAWRGGARGLAEVESLPDALRELAAGAPEPPAGGAEPAEMGPDDEFGAALGSIGGGNHFAEVTRVQAPGDIAAAGRFGLKKGALAVVVHSGSRGVGAMLGRRWSVRELRDEADIARYRADLAGACRFAQANRFLLGYRLLKALGAARPSKLRGSFDIAHNDVVREAVGGAPAWVHRKGAAPARAGEPTIVLGSRGAPSYVMEGAGNADVLASVAHGAGRKMGRTEAKEKLRSRYRRADLTRTSLGGRVVCDDHDVLYEEHPDAYKPVEPVMRSLVAHGAASNVVALVPVVTVKR